MDTLSMYRRRAYADAQSRLTSKGARAIFALLAADPLMAAALRQDRGDLATPEPDAARQDSQTLAAFARQLEHVMTETYEEPFPDLGMASGQVIDIDSSVPEGAESFVYYVYSGASLARFSSAYSGGTAPTTTIQGARVTGNIESMENAYEYSFRDLRAAAFAGVPLDSMLAKYAKRGHEELLQEAGLWGREDLGLPGFVNHPNITVTQAAADGTASSREWADKTVDLILRDHRVLIDTPGQLSYGMRETTHVLYSREEMRLLSSLRMGAGDGGYTVLKFLRETYTGVEFGVMLELAASQSDGNLDANAALAYVKNREFLRLVAPMAFKQYPPERRDLKIRVMCESSTGGVICKEPLTVHRLDGVGDS